MGGVREEPPSPLTLTPTLSPTPTTTLTLNLYPTHHFVGTTQFNQAHSHTRLKTMSSEDTAIYEEMAAQDHTHRRLPTASISGGVSVTGWTQISGNTYSAVVPSPMLDNQLFVDNRRVVRTRAPMNHSDYLQYAAPLNDSTTSTIWISICARTI
jgi:hypothetical protein